MMMQAGPKARLIVVALACVAAFPAASQEPRERGWRDRAGDRHDGGQRDRPGHGGPSIVIEPQIDLSRSRRAPPDDPGIVLAAVEYCARVGVRSFVECLRGNHRPVMIRRLEACVASEAIPHDLERVAACLPPPRMR